jgi:hypothetical protein
MRLQTYYKICIVVLILTGVLFLALITVNLQSANLLEAFVNALDTLMGDIPENTQIPYLSRVLKFLGWLVIPSVIAIFITAAENKISDHESKLKESFEKSLFLLAGKLGMNESQAKEFVNRAFNAGKDYANK